MYDVCFYEAFPEEEASLRSRLPEQVKACFVAETTQENPVRDPPARFISIRTQSEIPLEWANQLDAVLARSTGYDHLVRYREAVAPASPALGYLPLYCARAVAEHAMLMWTALLRKLPTQSAQFQSFDRAHLTGREVEGRKLLVVGVGHIGWEVIRVGEGLGMTVQGVDPVRKHEAVDYVKLEAALPEADIVVLAMNLTAENRGFFDEARLAQCKQGAILINIARGELSPPSTLLRALESGQLGGVGLDVYAEESELAVALRAGQEPKGEEARAVLSLQKLPQVICTPHNAFNTEEALVRKAEQSVAQVRHFLKEKKFVWDVPA